MRSYYYIKLARLTLYLRVGLRALKIWEGGEEDVRR